MEQPSTLPGLPQRVLQGVILGIVLAIPVVIYAYFQTRTVNAAPPVVPSGSSATAKLPMRKAPAPVVSTKRNSGKSGSEVETIPASQMHIRIDRGDRPAVPVKGTPAGAQANDEEE